MAGQITDSLTADPSGKIVKFAGTTNVTWDGVGSVLFSGSAYGNNLVAYNGLRMMTGIDSYIEIDIKCETDNVSRRHWGIFLGDPATYSGYRFFGLDGTCGVSKYAAGVESSLSATQVNAANPFSVGGTYTVRIERTAAGVFTFKVNGTTHLVTVAGTSVSVLYPCAFTYVSSLRIYEIRASCLNVSGVVRDDTGALCARAIRLYNRDTGELLVSGVSNAVTGAYALSVLYSGEVQRVVNDDTAGTLHNDLIDRVIPA